MRRLSTLETRLVEWGREYGGGKYEDNGWQGLSCLYSMMKYHGKPPQGLNPKNMKDWTPADDVQRAVDIMAKDSGGYTLEQVIRCHYMTPGLAMDSRLDRLRGIGCSMGKATYYRRLDEAHKAVAKLLGLTDAAAILREVIEGLTRETNIGNIAQSS